MSSTLKFFLAMIIINSVALSQTSTREASVQNMIGSVKVRKGESAAWKDARPGMKLKEKDAVRTFVESQVEIVTKEGSVIRLDENTALEISSLKEFNDGAQQTKINILNGTVLSNVKKLLNTSSKFEFETPTATAAIRGTRIEFEVTSDKTSIKLYEGEVVVSSKGTMASVSLKNNQMVTIVKNQKTISVETLTSERKAAGGADSVKTDTVPADTAKPGQSNADSVKTDSTAPVHKAAFDLVISAPTEGQIISQPGITVSGSTTYGADVTINGMQCQVNSNGSFSAKIPIPDEENSFVLDIVATYDGVTKKASRHIAYKPPFTLVINRPQDKQTVSSTSVQVSGQVTPASAELTVSDVKMPVQSNGKFSGLISIPDEEGQVSVNFEATYQGVTKSETRAIIYERLIDVNKPVIQPVQLPKISSVNRQCFTIFDKTTEDEITFYTIVDGGTSSETGQPNSSFCLQLQEGVHEYSVYAEDKRRNRTQVVAGTVSFLKMRPLLQIRKPAGGQQVIRIPPGTPGSDFSPIYTLEFSILNLPENDMRLVKEATVLNETTGRSSTQKDLIDNTLDFDVQLQRGENRIIVKVTDINNLVTQYSSAVIITVR